MFPHTYFAACYFAPSYWPPSGVGGIIIPPTTYDNICFRFTIVDKIKLKCYSD